ncbi:hypothetical protein EAY29_24945, partial [Vibrio anguillarum]
MAIENTKPLPNTTWLSEDGMSIYVERVYVYDDDFCLIGIIDTYSKDDPLADGDELTLEEWHEFVQ